MGKFDHIDWALQEQALCTENLTSGFWHDQTQSQDKTVTKNY